MSKVKVRIVVEETLRYDQVIEISRELFEALDWRLEDGIAGTDEIVRDYLDKSAVTCLDCEVQRFEIVEDEA